MKRKSFGLIIALASIMLLSFALLKGMDYYKGRYEKSDVYFVRIPNTQSTEIQDLFDDSGKKADTGRRYEFTGYNDKGEPRVLIFSYTTDDPSKLLQPGTYLRITASKTIVLGQDIIAEDQVPELALNKIKP